MKSKVHPTYKAKYRVANWSAYNQALVRRGDVTGRCCMKTTLRVGRPIDCRTCVNMPGNSALYHPREPREADGWLRDHWPITARYTADNRPFHGPHPSSSALAICPSRRFLRTSGSCAVVRSMASCIRHTPTSGGPLGVGGRPPVLMPAPGAQGGPAAGSL